MIMVEYEMLVKLVFEKYKLSYLKIRCKLSNTEMYIIFFN